MRSPLTDSRTDLAWEVLLEPGGRPGAEHMAIDAALLAEADRSAGAFLRLYRFDPPCLSLGRNEPAGARYDRSAIARRGLDVVRRPTGGRAVWHEHDLTYAVAAPLELFGSLATAYRAIHLRLAAALRALGADVAIASERLRPPATARDRPAACFAAPVGGEILAGGRKLVGSAQVRQGSAFLQHGSILLDGSQDVIRVVSRQPSAVRGETTLAAALGRNIGFDEVAAAIVAAWAERISATDCYRPLPPSTAWFSDPAWTWRR